MKLREILWMVEETLVDKDYGWNEIDNKLVLIDNCNNREIAMIVNLDSIKAITDFLEWVLDAYYQNDTLLTRVADNLNITESNDYLMLDFKQKFEIENFLFQLKSL